MTDPDKDTPDQFQQTLRHLRERVKELTALHTTARLFQEEQESTKSLLRKIVDLLPPSWQYPEITAGRIEFDGMRIVTPNYCETPWVQQARFVCHGNLPGLVEVVYLEEKPYEVEGPFLEEERSLINSLAEMLKIHLDRKRSNEELRKFVKVYRDATDPIIIEDLNGTIVDVNPETEQDYEWPAEELIGAPIMKLIPRDGQGAARRLRAQCLRGEVVRNVSAVRQTKSGKSIPVLVSLSLLTNEGGTPIGLVTFTKDISQIKQAEAALQAAHDELEARVQSRTAELSKANHALTEEITHRKTAEQRLETALVKLQQSHDDLQAILNQLHIGIVLLNSEGVIIFLSQGMQPLSHRPLKKYVGCHWEELFQDPETIRHLHDLMGQPPTKRESLTVEMTPTAGGRHCWVTVDVREDPRDANQKILYLYDISEVEDLRRLLSETGKFQDLIGKSPAMQMVFQHIKDLARVDSTVLIEGETGTGKELVARAIHRTSSRQDGPFLAVNCAGLTESLVASQLFGHIRGAFTGAVSDQKGVFEAAEGGTLFLDEIGDIPMTVQTSLLRVLQEREITRVGESKLRKIDVRVIAATHHNLANDVKSGTFRADLLYRIRVGRILLPPLRERREDIPLLASAFLGQYRATTGRPVESISHQALRLLIGYSWPGNVRELQHAIEFGVVRSRSSSLEPHDFPPEILGREEHPSPKSPQSTFDSKKDAAILEALEKTGGNKSAAAKHLGMSRVTLYRHLHRLGVQ